MEKAKNIHPLHQLYNLIDKYTEEKDKMTLSELQDMRENLALNLFYISTDASQAIANYESKEFERKRIQAQKEEELRYKINPKTQKQYTISDAERIARIGLVEIETEVSEALRQKERVRIILRAVEQILNALSSKISNISKN